jgi:hypothetical protein
VSGEVVWTQADDDIASLGGQGRELTWILRAQLRF